MQCFDIGTFCDIFGPTKINFQHVLNVLACVSLKI